MTTDMIISPSNANRLYWLGRYEERVYTTLHLLRKCYDRMIDGEPQDYEAFWRRFNVDNTYSTVKEFEWGMLYDETNPSSVISAQRCALDNAMVLRNCIMTESLGYLEMSMAMLRRRKDEGDVNITDLQSVTDWSLAFFGSVEQRVDHTALLGMLMAGRQVEYLDTLLRFDYPDERVSHNYDSLRRTLETVPQVVNEPAMRELDELFRMPELTEQSRRRALALTNSLVNV